MIIAFKRTEDVLTTDVTEHRQVDRTKIEIKKQQKTKKKQISKKDDPN